MLEQKLLETQTLLKNFDFSNFKTKEKQFNLIKGQLIEYYVNEWLNVTGAKQFEINNTITKNYTFKKCNNKYLNQIIVQDNKTNEIVSEFDNLVTYENNPYIIEVKSHKLNNIKEKIPRYRKIAKELLNENPKVLLFFPIRGKEKIKIEYEKKIEYLKCIDLKYSQNSLFEQINKYIYKNNDYSEDYVNNKNKSKLESNKKLF